MQPIYNNQINTERVLTLGKLTAKNSSRTSGIMV